MANKKKETIGIMKSAMLPGSYARVLEALKERIRQNQIKAALSVNRHLIELYWHIGKTIIERQQTDGWGKSVVERLAHDLHKEFPDIAGFSTRNIWRMRAFYLAYTEEIKKVPQLAAEFSGKNLPQPVAEIPWGHNAVLLEKIDSPAERIWYAVKTIENGWSRNILVFQIESDLYRRQGKAVSNYRKVLSSPQSDLAHQTLKDPYIFDFLTITKRPMKELLKKSWSITLQNFFLSSEPALPLWGGSFTSKCPGRTFTLISFSITRGCIVMLSSS